MKKAIFFFPNFEYSIHRHKDPGRILNELEENGYYIYLFSKHKQQITIKNVEFIYFQNNRIAIFKLLQILLSKKIERSIVFHIKELSNFALFLVNLFSKGILKMDISSTAGPYPWEKWCNTKSKTNPLYFSKDHNRISRSLLKQCISYNFAKSYLIVVEDDVSKEYYKKKYSIKSKIISIPNLTPPYTGKLESKNQILHIGRIGSDEKNSELVVQSFLNSNLKDEFNLILAGSIEPFFKDYLDKINTDRVVYIGMLDRKELFQLYSESRYLLMPSKYEGFANVFGEALSHGLEIIVSKNTAISNLGLNPVHVLNELNQETVTSTLNHLNFKFDKEKNLRWYENYYKTQFTFSEITT